MKTFWTFFWPGYPKVLLYMLQASEYNIRDYFEWFHRTRDFRQVMKRRPLVWTSKIKLLALFELIVILTMVLAAWFLGNVWLPLGLIILLLPFILAYSIVLPLLVGEVLIQRPREKRLIATAKEKLQTHTAKKIAIAGSYGKTTTKEVLKTMLGTRYKVAATPGNMNTPLGTSRFIAALDGDEEIIIFEMGESHVGDIKELSDLTDPDMGVITGINQAHLKTFKTIQNTIATIFELQDYLGDKPVYKNITDEYVRSRVDDSDAFVYDNDHIAKWELVKSNTTLEGTDIVVEKGNRIITAHTALIGEHMFGTLLLAVGVADYFGLTDEQIKEGLEKIVPFEHRMQPRRLHDAWIIDDTYNGNIKGMEAGLVLLKKSGAKRRVYVTPGLVEQGDETEKIHERLGSMIAESADVVVLMKNSVTDYIKSGLEKAGFNGKVITIEEPLEFYLNLEHFIAAGDVVLMQNDWSDNYA